MYNQKMMEGLRDGSATKYVLLPWSTQKLGMVINA